MFRIATTIEDASKHLADPLVQLDITMNSRTYVYHKRISGREELEKIILDVSKKLQSNACLSVVVSNKAGEGRLLVCGDAVIGAVFRDGKSGVVLTGERAYIRILEVVTQQDSIVDIMAVERDKLPADIRSLVERARVAAIPAGRPPMVWIGSVLYGFKVERIIGEGGISYVLEGIGANGRFALKILRERSRFGSPLAVGNRGAIESFARMATAMMKMTFASRGVVEAALEERGVTEGLRDKVRLLTGFADNIIRVYGVYIPREEYRNLDEYVKTPPVVVMEYVDGVTLDRIEANVSPFEARKIVYEVAGALALAHTLGFGHFDVKPQNVMVVRVSGFLKAKVFDFTALPIDRRRPPALEEITPEYADPYSLLHGARAYPSYDVYSLGLMAYRLFYKRRPYARLALNYVVLKRVVPKLAESMGRVLPPEAQEYTRKFERLAASMHDPDSFLRAAEELLEAIEPLGPPPGQPENIVDILRKMLALTPERRYRDAIELLKDLGSLFGVTF
ncbi:serine/threonine protein kinase [Pyrolobus fumarii 1A]|uniref:Serine/threonine protein kinase n=1 Tax=Pyrolobus fumarii (strain DSM 11204 / 1A) TaxID=694429 RepID=G0EEB0_PYRF1|nr:serine/threonine protein kinase [Pyrolobus fumarii]AEM38804.1 serine/threonine protein kinase [Pyrolobus fumarii 1A]